MILSSPSVPELGQHQNNKVTEWDSRRQTNKNKIEKKQMEK